MEISVTGITNMEIYLHFIYFSKHTYFNILNEEKEHLPRFPLRTILLICGSGDIELYRFNHHHAQVIITLIT